MLSKMSLIGIAVLALALPAHASGRWDVAFDGGWVRCLLDIDAQNETVSVKVYDITQMGANAVRIDDVVVIDRGENYLLQGVVSQGSFKIGLGGTRFTVGDRFFLWASKYSGDVLLLFAHDVTSYWFASLKAF